MTSRVQRYRALVAWSIASDCVPDFTEADKRQAEEVVKAAGGTARVGWRLSNPPVLVVIDIETEATARALAGRPSTIPHVGTPQVRRESAQSGAPGAPPVHRNPNEPAL